MPILPTIEPPKEMLAALNNLYAIEVKVAQNGDNHGLGRHIGKIKEALDAMFHYFYEDPNGQAYSETRTDIEASIAGDGVGELIIVEVIKPIIRFGDRKFSRVVQKGMVIAEPRRKNVE